jgi:hypothetical protein
MAAQQLLDSAKKIFPNPAKPHQDFDEFTRAFEEHCARTKLPELLKVALYTHSFRNSTAIIDAADNLLRENENITYAQMKDSLMKVFNTEPFHIKMQRRLEEITWPYHDIKDVREFVALWEATARDANVDLENPYWTRKIFQKCTTIYNGSLCTYVVTKNTGLVNEISWTRLKELLLEGEGNKQYLTSFQPAYHSPHVTLSKASLYRHDMSRHSGSGGYQAPVATPEVRKYVHAAESKVYAPAAGGTYPQKPAPQLQYPQKPTQQQQSSTPSQSKAPVVVQKRPSKDPAFHTQTRDTFVARRHEFMHIVCDKCKERGHCARNCPLHLDP